jgi:hypothetical protein
MSRRRLNWDKARRHGRPSLDYRREFETPDRAQRWIEAAERRQRENRAHARDLPPSRQSSLPLERRTTSRSSTVSLSTGWITASSSQVPW